MCVCMYVCMYVCMCRADGRVDLQEVTKNHISPDDDDGNDYENTVTQETVPSSSEALKMVEGLRSFIEAEPNVNTTCFNR